MFKLNLFYLKLYFFFRFLKFLDMDLIKDLEKKFHKIEAKLNSNQKNESAWGKYNNDVEKINRIFNSKQEKYENGLNERRDLMLKQIISKRDEHLHKVVKFIQNIDPNYHYTNLFQLKCIDKSVKYNYIVFACGSVSVNQSISARTQFGKEFKYTKLIHFIWIHATKKNILIKI